MKARRSGWRLAQLALASSALLLCGCASLPNSGAAGDAKLDRTLPDTCEKILKTDPLPAVTAKTKAGVAFLKDDAALITADGRIDAGRGCVHDMRQQYSGEAIK
jgi:hypothetical protein